MRVGRVLVAAGAAALLASGTAAAHVDVFPQRVELKQSTQFTVRVPTEREVPTVAVRVDFPPQITVYAFPPLPRGWTMKERRAPNGTVIGVVYRGGAIPVGGYMDFNFLGTPFTKGTSVWKAYQTYADGKVKPWTGPPEDPGAISEESGPTAPGPSAAVEVVAQGALAGAAAPSPATPTKTTSSGAPVWLSLLAVGIAAAGFLLSAFLWTKRPMVLPDDPPDRE